MSEEEKEAFIQEIKPFAHQKIFFSYYAYGRPYYLFNPRYNLKLEKDLDVLLISAIANTEYLVDYLAEEVDLVRDLNYEDHHYFTAFDVGRLKKIFENMKKSKKAILTTEKDAMRLELHRDYLVEQKMPIFVLPVEVRFHFDEGEKFNADLKEFLLNFR